MRRFSGTLAIAVVMTLLAGCPPVSDPVPLSRIERYEMDAFNAVNDIRADNSLATLIMDPDARLVARAHSRDMIERDFFSHTNPDGFGPGDRLDNAGIPWEYSGENIAWNQGFDDPPATAVEGWMDSPGHRANILDQNGDLAWTHTGMGVAISPDNAVYFTQVFIGQDAKSGKRVTAGVTRVFTGGE